MVYANNVPVLMYHHVTAKGGSLSVSYANFESQMHGLAKNGYTTLSAQQFANFMRGQRVPKKSVLITFDDGYLDNWVYAHPVLKRYGLNAVLFAITGLIGSGALRSYNGQVSCAELPECPSHNNAKLAMFGENPDTVMLRWEEIEAMRAAGTFEVHNHTHTHKRWDLESATAQEKNDRIRSDIQMAQRVLSRRLGSASEHFCWPQGYFDDDYKNIALSLGLNVLYTTDARGQNIANGDTSYIYRFAVRNRPYSWLRQRIWLATHPTFGPWYNSWKAAKEARKIKNK